jgi:hypothetical protein
LFVFKKRREGRRNLIQLCGLCLYGTGLRVGVLIAFYIVGIVLIDVVTDGATPSIDSHDLRLAFAQIVKKRASCAAALTGDNKIPLGGFADVQRHWGIPWNG